MRFVTILSISVASFVQPAVSQSAGPAEQATAAAIARVERIDPQLRSVIALDPTALAQARRIDTSSRRGLLAGQPVLIKDNIAEEIKMLKEQPGKNLVIFGSPGAAKTLLKLGLIDEFLLTLCPVVLGGGKSVFDDGGEKIRLKLLSSRTLKSGIIASRYELEK